MLEAERARSRRSNDAAMNASRKDCQHWKIQWFNQTSKRRFNNNAISISVSRPCDESSRAALETDQSAPERGDPVELWRGLPMTRLGGHGAFGGVHDVATHL